MRAISTGPRSCLHDGHKPIRPKHLLTLYPRCPASPLRSTQEVLREHDGLTQWALALCSLLNRAGPGWGERNASHPRRHTSRAPRVQGFAWITGDSTPGLPRTAPSLPKGGPGESGKFRWPPMAICTLKAWRLLFCISGSAHLVRGDPQGRLGYSQRSKSTRQKRGREALSCPSTGEGPW